MIAPTFMSQNHLMCHTFRDLHYRCELHPSRSYWTLSNGYCIGGPFPSGSWDMSSLEDRCLFLFKCGVTHGLSTKCPCNTSENCAQLLRVHCADAGLLELEYPWHLHTQNYLRTYYFTNRTTISLSYVPDSYKLQSRIKCRGFHLRINQNTTQKIDKRAVVMDSRWYEEYLCGTIGSIVPSNGDGNDIAFKNLSVTAPHYDSSCWNHHTASMCNNSCLSIHRVGDGINDCGVDLDEITPSDKICNEKHRFRCSPSKCLRLTVLGNKVVECVHSEDEYLFDSGVPLSTLQCRKPDKTSDCLTIRTHLERSLANLTNRITNITNDQASSNVIPFTRYCDTYYDLGDASDESVDDCKREWICGQYEFRCSVTGQCIPISWVCDGKYKKARPRFVYDNPYHRWFRAQSFDDFRHFLRRKSGFSR
ncbi:unnamed protein product [Rotaria sp. Silwood1]|nr:unnamed protein product [Rotaria sp. Silwood1]